MDEATSPLYVRGEPQLVRYPVVQSDGFLDVVRNGCGEFDSILMANTLSKRHHLQRLSQDYYVDDAIVHWTITIRDRETGWLTPKFLYRFRELLAHTTFRYGLACPIFCLMPDHIHMIWMGLFQGSNQLNAMKHFRSRCDDSLSRVGFRLQDQSYDHVLQDNERLIDNLIVACEYIARNPERAGLVNLDAYAAYSYSGCMVPGYPELRPFDSSFWDHFDRIIAFLRKDGLLRIQSTG